MAAPKGNQFWKIALQMGRPKEFETPEELLEKALEYFEWCEENPMEKKDVAKAGDHFGEEVVVTIPRPYSIEAMCTFIGIDVETFRNYSEEDSYKDFFRACRKIKGAIRSQQFEGATVGNYKENIISRMMGLSDKKEVDHTSKGKRIDSMTKSERKEREEELLSRLEKKSRKRKKK